MQKNFAQIRVHKRRSITITLAELLFSATILAIVAFLKAIINDSSAVH